MARARAMDSAGRSRPQVTMSRIRGQLADAEVRHLVTKV